MQGDTSFTIGHEPSGKPFLQSHPEALNPQPSSLNSHLSTLNSHPSSLNSQLSTLNPHPLSLNSHLSTLNSHPSSLNSHLSTLNSHPTSLNPQLSTLNPHLSISHTHGYAALLLSDDCRVGVDIEYRSDRVERIASRFIRPDEKAETTDEKLLLWSAKEAVYKLFSEDRLGFFDMRALSIGDGYLTMWVEKKRIAVSVCYEFTDDYVLTYVLDA
ncbi:MAG: 4'-phosphopantetheinyl transferase superfamily protein [Prevotella sp.]|nr:4'-phosphopantetheinyl transferase superfamily protein [Prevotella sp.]